MFALGFVATLAVAVLIVVVWSLPLAAAGEQLQLPPLLMPPTRDPLLAVGSLHQHVVPGSIRSASQAMLMLRRCGFSCRWNVARVYESSMKHPSPRMGACSEVRRSRVLYRCQFPRINA